MIDYVIQANKKMAWKDTHCFILHFKQSLQRSLLCKKHKKKYDYRFETIYYSRNCAEYWQRRFNITPKEIKLSYIKDPFITYFNGGYLPP